MDQQRVFNLNVAPLISRGVEASFWCPPCNPINSINALKN